MYRRIVRYKFSGFKIDISVPCSFGTSEEELIKRSERIMMNQVYFESKPYEVIVI